jgi:hypothetical protein
MKNNSIQSEIDVVFLTYFWNDCIENTKKKDQRQNKRKFIIFSIGSFNSKIEFITVLFFSEINLFLTLILEQYQKLSTKQIFQENTGILLSIVYERIIDSMDKYSHVWFLKPHLMETNLDELPWWRFFQTPINTKLWNVTEKIFLDGDIVTSIDEQ